MKRIALILFALSLSCGSAPDNEIVEQSSAFMFPPNGFQWTWFDSYAKTHTDCGAYGARDSSTVGAVALREQNDANRAGIEMDSNAMQRQEFSNTWDVVGTPPDPGPPGSRLPQTQHTCTVQLVAPINSEADQAGFSRGSWALETVRADGPLCAVKWDYTHILGQSMHVNHLPGGYWADWILEPLPVSPQGWHLRASGQIYGGDGLPAGCSFFTNAYLYQATGPYPR